MKITLQVSGREMTFSEEELVAIIEKHFASQASEQEAETEQVEQISTEGKWFEVTPLAIDQNLFRVERKDEKQERTRGIILEAFNVLNRNPEKYGRTFEIMIPEKTWLQKTVVELKTLASDFGDHNADWIEQALEWAQRIYNGESWNAICNTPDTAKWYRLVRWKYGVMRLVGGSCVSSSTFSASNVGNFNYGSHEMIGTAVPLVVRYK